MDFENFEARLENWSRVVRSPRFQSGECALWAKWYVLLRDSGKPMNAPTMTKDEWDGWLVEKAWAMLPNHVSKWTLKYSYVWNMSPEQVQTRMRKTHNANLRGAKFDLVIAGAKSELRKNISTLTAKKILKFVAEDACKPESCVL
ncbi:hypothetical protein AB4Y43_01275 [Paraburkholderia sp. BR10872]|uniref:hypothetical protein n=1 Tax=Paraburkholderia sp. BR10872 TaxID=3236989 RepID=UPI0034D2152E